jgi:hypothetical protein
MVSKELVFGGIDFVDRFSDGGEKESPRGFCYNKEAYTMNKIMKRRHQITFSKKEYVLQYKERLKSAFKNIDIYDEKSEMYVYDFSDLVLHVIATDSDWENTAKPFVGEFPKSAFASGVVA